MRRHARYPTGEHLLASWLPTSEKDLALIGIPGEAEPVVLEWTRYEWPGPRPRPPQYAGVLWHGATRLAAREHLVHTRVLRRGTYRKRIVHRDAEVVGCTELVEVLGAGKPLPVARVQRGAYAGLWVAEVEVEQPVRAHGVRERVCRCVLDLEQGVVRVFRWHVLRDLRLPAPGRRVRLGRP